MPQDNIPEIKVEVRAVGNQLLATTSRADTNQEIISNLFTFDQTSLLFSEARRFLERGAVATSDNQYMAKRELKDSPETECKSVEGFGQQFFKWLFGDKDFGTDIHKLTNFLNNNDTYRTAPQIRLTLRLHQEAHSLFLQPWEYLHDGQNFLLTERFTLSRHLMGLGDSPLGDLPRPLRVLIVISSPSGVNELNTEKELAVLQEALDGKEVVYQILEDATLSALGEELGRGNYHVVHYTGHGGFDEQKKASFLALEDEDGGLEKAFARDLLPHLHKSQNLRLVVLSGCQTARSSGDNSMSSVGTGLLNGGIPAVLAMQFSILDPSAIVMARAFYGALATAKTLEQATAEARIAMWQRKPEEGLGERERPEDWGIPALYLRCQDGSLLGSSRQQIEEETPARMDDLGTLPRPLHFVGRKVEQRQLRRLLRQGGEMNRVAYLQAIGGIGKSTLAARLATRPGTKLDGVFVVRCHELATLGELPGKLAGWLAGQGQARHAEAAQILNAGTEPACERGRRASQYFRKQRYLLIFDNLESLLEPGNPALTQTAQEVLELLVGLSEGEGRSTLLFTSRLPWNSLADLQRQGRAVIIPLNGLSLQETVYLMQNMQEPRRLARASYKEKIRVWNMVGGHPFTLELLEGWLSDGRGLDKLLDNPQTAGRLSEAWEKYFLGDLLARLSTEEQQALTQLAVFEGEFWRETYGWAGVADETIARWAGLSLAVKERVDNYGDPWYSLHPVVRTYLLERLTQEERNPPHANAALFYQEKILRPWKQLLGNGQMLAEDAATLKEILVGETNAAVRLLKRQVQQTQDLAEVRAALKLALEWRGQLFAAGQFAEAGTLVNDVLWLILERFGERALAKRLLRESIESREGSGKAATLANLATLLKDEGDLDGALTTYQTVFETFEAEESKGNMAVVLGQISSVLMNKGDYIGAIAEQKRSLVISREISNQEGEARSLHQLSILYYLTKDYQLALETSQQAKGLARELNRQDILAPILHQQGGILKSLDQPAEALELFKQSLKISGNIGNEAGVADSLAEIGKLLSDKGQYEAAEQCFVQALETSRRQNNPVKTAIRLEALSILYERQGDLVDKSLQKAYYHKALEKFEQALILFKQYSPPNIANTESNIARVKQKLGEE